MRDGPEGAYARDGGYKVKTISPRLAQFDGTRDVCGRKIVRGVNKIARTIDYDWVHEQCAITTV